MSNIHRYYKCGCALDDEQFCKEAEPYVWKERDAGTARALDDISREDAEAYAWQEGYGRGWMNCHIGTQSKAGDYEDVDFDSPEMQPPDDGYDEDPKQVGYPS